MFSILPLRFEAIQGRLGEAWSEIEKALGGVLGALDSELGAFGSHTSSSFALEVVCGDECGKMRGFFLVVLEGSSESSPDSELLILSPFSNEVMFRALAASEGLEGVVIKEPHAFYKKWRIGFRAVASLGEGLQASLEADLARGLGALQTGLDPENPSDMSDLGNLGEVRMALSEALRHILWHFEAGLEPSAEKNPESRG